MRTPGIPNWPVLNTALSPLLALLLCAGCANNASRDNLAAAYQQLASPTPDYNQVSQAADAYLAEQPTGPDAADALYLKGRAFEERGQRSAATGATDFSTAYSLYSQALARSPRPALEGLIRTGMGNVLYFQERYAAAINELSAGHEKLEKDWDKAWALYRIGLCNQRLGRWEEADRMFSSVATTYPQVTDAARRAREHQGARAFWVQVAAYTTPQLAENTIADLKKQTLPAARFADPSGKGIQYVRVGPYPTYDAARSTRQRLTTKYPGALILP